MTILGPRWSSHDLEIRAGRFPLSVEGHLLNMTARLVPGATTVTTGSRYYTLHGYVARIASDRDLDDDATLELLRRCEVVVAAASELHPAPHLPASHGAGVVGEWLRRDGQLDMVGLSTPQTGYAKPKRGFLGPYLGSEITLGILDGQLVTGDRYDHPAVRPGFDGLVDLATQSIVSQTDLEGAGLFAVGAASTSSDGAWLARMLSGHVPGEALRADEVRRNTIRMLARSMLLTGQTDPVEAVRNAVAYGRLVEIDPVLSSIPEVEPWRGVFYRHDSVGAWRRLWARMVQEITGIVPRSTIVDFVADSLGPGTLQSLLDSLPATVDAAGHPVPAESIVKDERGRTCWETLALLALGARRTDEADGKARDALVGDQRRLVVLSPLWVKQWLDERRSWSLAEVGADLVDVLFSRARRIAMRKMRINREGHVWLPTVIREENGLLSKTSDEGRDNVGLRLSQLLGLLAAVGVLDPAAEGAAVVTDHGDELLKVRA